MTEEDIEQLKRENAELGAALSRAEQRFQELEALLMRALLRIEELERQKAKDSHNSSLPPSRDHDKRHPMGQRPKSQKRKGGQAGHRGHTLLQVKEPDEVIVHRPLVCEHCQWDLRAEPGQLVERRQVHDLPAVRVQVQEHQLHAGKLSAECQRTCTVWPRAPGSGRLSLAVPVAFRRADVRNVGRSV